MTDKLLPITMSDEELEEALIKETDVDNIKNIINLFNLNIKKKDIVRTAKLNDLQNKVYEQINKRLTYKADEFSNSDLLNYFKTIQETINKSDTSLDKVDTPAIQIIQNQLNVSSEDPSLLNLESRQKISDIVQKFLALTKEEKESIDIPYQEINDNEDYEQLELSFDEEN